MSFIDGSARGIAAAAWSGATGLRGRQVTLQAFVPPARDQELDGEPAEKRRQQDDDLVPVREDQVTEGRQELLKSAHPRGPPVEMRPRIAGQGRWLAAGTLIER